MTWGIKPLEIIVLYREIHAKKDCLQSNHTQMEILRLIYVLLTFYLSYFIHYQTIKVRSLIWLPTVNRWNIIEWKFLRYCYMFTDNDYS